MFEEHVAWIVDQAGVDVFEAVGSVTLEFFGGYVPVRKSAHVPGSRPSYRIGSLHVRPAKRGRARDLGRPAGVQLELAQGVTASELQRFAWRQWLDAAAEVARGGGRDVHPLAGFRTGKLSRTLSKTQGVKVRPSPRPGRAGHPIERYRRLADRYRELIRLDRAPIRIIAREWKVAPATAAGWIRRCRELELLPPGRRGKAG